MKTRLKENAIGIAKLVFPINLVEALVLGIFLLAYGGLAAVIALDYRIVFDNRIPWDAYFSFDNRAIIMTGGGYERHPLANYFFDIIRSTGLAISGGKMDATFRIVIAEFSATCISLTILQVYKYLRNIIALPIKPSLLIVIFFSLFSTNILLAFTPETYTYTLFCLVLFNYYAAGKINHGKNLSFGAVTLGGIFIGGLTITNIVKVYIPLLFEKGLFKNLKQFFSTAGKVALSVAVFVLLYLNRLNFEYERVLTKTTEQYEKFSKPKVTPLWDMMASWFTGGPMLFPSFVLRDYHNAKNFQYKAIFMDTYSSPYSYLFIGIVVALLAWSYVKNFRNPLVQILIFSLSVDIFIHCVLKFGLHTAYIYGGHYVFVVPLLLGWLLSRYHQHQVWRNCLLGLFAVLISFLACNNLYRMQEFFVFLNEYYR